MQLAGVGMGATPATTATATTIPNTLTAGLSLWTNPLTAFQDIPGVFTLLTQDYSAYGTFAIGALLPVAAVALLLLTSMGGSGGRRR